MAKEKESAQRDIEEIFEMVTQLADKVSKLEKEIEFIKLTASQHISGEFERWLDAKVRGFEYGPELKLEVMPKSKGKNLQEAKRIFFDCRDKLFEKRYPDAPRGPQTWRW